MGTIAVEEEEEEEGKGEPNDVAYVHLVFQSHSHDFKKNSTNSWEQCNEMFMQVFHNCFSISFSIRRELPTLLINKCFMFSAA